MALLASPLAWTLLLLPLTYYLYTSLSAKNRFKAFARANGCEAPFNADSAWPWSVDRLYAVVTARKKGKDPMDDYMAPPLYEHATLERTMLGGKKTIETIEPANIRAILSGKFDDWVIGEGRHSAFRAIMGHNIFTSDGAFWQHSRAMLRPQFQRDLINNLEGTERSAANLFEAMGAVDADGWTSELDFAPLGHRFVLDNATEFLFGESVESQKSLMEAANPSASPSSAEDDNSVGRLAGGEKFATAFATCNYYMTLRVRLQQLKWLADDKVLKDAVSTVRSVSDSFVRRTLAGARKPKSHQKFDLLSSMIEHTRDERELSDQSLGIMFAGRDTTSSLLLWTTTMLGYHPQVYAKLRDIVLERFPQPLGEVLDFAQLKSCPYLQYVLNETMRVYQPVPLNLRVAARDTVLPVGGGPDGSKPVAVKKGQQALWNTYAMHRSTRLWGEDAMEFRPERWEDAKKTRLLGGGWAFLPFSGGPRVCLGQQFAMTEAAYCLVRLLQRYDRIELDKGVMPTDYRWIKKTIGGSLAPMEVRLRWHQA